MSFVKKNNVITIVLSNPGTIIARMIKTYTGEPYVHVSLSLDRKLNYMYSFGRKKLYTPLGGGFVHEKTDQGIYSLYRDTKCSIYALVVTGAQYERIKKVVQAFSSKAHLYKYNYIGILGVMVNIPFKSEQRYFCSEFVAEVLQKGGVNLFNKSPSLVTPRDFRKCTALKLVYTGKLIEYNS